jgi:catechol 2,3-dioxygenase-like lactoylglutathione lyase family enzyme
MRLHHVQVACPPGGEDDARRFYGEGLGLTEVDKPPALAGRGGAWFRAYDEAGEVAAELHVGVEEPFAPARKAHPALLLPSPEVLEEVALRLEELGFEVDRSEWDTFPGYRRVHVRDAPGNRVELLARPRTASIAP